MLLVEPLDAVYPGKGAYCEVVCHTEQTVQVVQLGRPLPHDMVNTGEHQVAS